MRNALIIAVCAVALVIFFRVKRPTSAPNAPSASNVSNVVAKPALTQASEPSKTLAAPSAPTSFAHSGVMNALRAALATQDGAALERAAAALLDYINAHPEQVDDYVSILRTELDEHVLRRFTFALADSEVGLLNNEKIVQAAIDMAKDRTVEQRQHIMLHLMSRFPEMRSEVYDAVTDLSLQDPNPQVKNSALTVIADWTESFPDKTVNLLNDIQKVFETSDDAEVRAYTYQLLALHTEKLPPDLHLALAERLKTETDSFTANLIAAALLGASEEVRQGALSQVRTAFDVAQDMDAKRNLLIQIVFLSKEGSLPLLQQNSTGDSLLAQDARDYAAIIVKGEGIEPAVIFEKRAVRDTLNAKKDDHDEH